jgi:MerR family transcriptional regulator, heat shock protein HspR
MARKNEPVYAISVAARLCDMHPQTLRLYERLGLVKPNRTDNRNRLYSDEDIERLKKIQRLTQDLGVNLAGVTVIFNLLEQMESMKAELQAEVDDLQTKLLDLEERLSSRT